MIITKKLPPGGRFRLLLTPSELPGKCVVCGSAGGDGRPFIDFGFSIDYYGAVYFCGPCMVECCNPLGWINQQQWNNLQEYNELLISRVQTLELINERLLSSFTDLSFINDLFSKLSNHKVSKQGEESNDFSLRGSDNETDLDESESNGPTNELGSEDLSDSDKSDEQNESDKSDGEFRLKL